MKKILTSVAALSLGLALIACGEKAQPTPTAAPVPAATEKPAAPAEATPAAAAATAAAAPAEGKPAEGAAAGDTKAATETKPAGDTKAAAPAKKSPVVSLGAQGDRARALAGEVRALTEEIRKLATEIDTRATAAAAAKLPSAGPEMEGLVNQFKEKVQTLDAKSKNLKTLMGEMDEQVGKLK